MNSNPIYTYLAASNSLLVHEWKLKQTTVDTNKQKSEFLQSSSQ